MTSVNQRSANKKPEFAELTSKSTFSPSGIFGADKLDTKAGLRGRIIEAFISSVHPSLRMNLFIAKLGGSHLDLGFASSEKTESE